MNAVQPPRPGGVVGGGPGMCLRPSAQQGGDLAGRRPVASGVRLGEAGQQLVPVLVAVGLGIRGEQQTVHARAVLRVPSRPVTTAAACCMRSAFRSSVPVPSCVSR